MAKIEASLEIGAPPQVVFDYLDDHDHIAELMPYMSDFEWNTKTHQVGTRLKMMGKSAGVSLPMVLETTQVTPGRQIAGVFAEGMKGMWAWHFVPTEKGTRVEAKMDYELPMGVVGQLADRLVVEREYQGNIEKTLAILKEKTEARR